MSRTPAHEHRAAGPQQVHCAVVTISDTRTLETDLGGQTVVDAIQAGGHSVTIRKLIPDDDAQIRQVVRTLSGDAQIDVVLLTGGTGISPRDQTYETLLELFDRSLPGYGELFRMLSFQEIGPAAMLSRACGGLIGQTVVLSMPGSPNAVKLAMSQLILPELRHLVQQAQKA